MIMKLCDVKEMKVCGEGEVGAVVMTKARDTSWVYVPLPLTSEPRPVREPSPFMRLTFPLMPVGGGL